MGRKWTRVATGLMLALLPAGVRGAGPDRSEPARRTVVLFFTVLNTASSPAEDVELIAVLPASNPYHQVHELWTDPPADQRTPDRLGQSRASWRLGRINPGQAASVVVLVQATVRAVRVDRTTRPAEPLSPAQRADYLRDDPRWLQLDKVAPILKEWVPEPSRDVTERARQIFQAVRRNCQYVLDSRRDTALDVLTKRRGSCTELSFAFIAMCRAGGIPARMVSAWVSRGGEASSIDTVNHRWAEYWDDRYGWVPVDLAPAAIHAENLPLTYRPESYFGHVPVGFLTVRDGGQEQPGLTGWSGWTVLRRGGGRLVVERGSAWQATGDERAERKLFEDAGQLLWRAPPEAARGRLAHWLKSDLPLARCLLIPLLGSPSAELRGQVAGRLAEGPDPSLAGVLLLWAGRTGDEEFRRTLLEQVGRMVRREDPKFRRQVLGEIGRSCLPPARPLAQDRADNDPNWTVRAAAKQALELLDKAASSTQPDDKPK